MRPSFMQRRGGNLAGDMHAKQRRQAAAPGTDTEINSATDPESGIDSGNDTEDDLSSAPPTTRVFRPRNTKSSTRSKILGGAFNRRRAVAASGVDSQVDSKVDFTISSPPPKRSLGRRSKSLRSSKDLARDINRRQEADASDADSEFGSALDVIISSPPPRRSNLRRSIKSSSSSKQVRGISRRQAAGAPDTDSELDSATDGVESATDDDLSAPSPRQSTPRRRATKSLSGGAKRRQAVGAPVTDSEVDSATDGVESATDNDVDSATDGEVAPPPSTVSRRSSALARASTRTIGQGKKAKRVDGRHFSRRQAADAPPTEPESAESGSEDEGQGTATDAPSPTDTTKPTGVSGPTEGPNGAIDMGRIGTETPDNSNPTAGAGETALPATETSDLGSSPAQAQPQEIGSDEQPGGIGRAGVIAMGTLIGLAVLAIVAFVIFKCRRRRNQSSGSRGSGLAFWRRRGGNDNINEKQLYTTRTPPSEKGQGRMMDNLMTAAYAAENGNAWGAGSRPASQQSSDSLWQQKQEAYARTLAAAPKGGKGSLYSNQLRNGFWKKDGGVTVPGKARVPAPAPSVAGKTEMTSQSGATESTWNTWGVVQHHEKPKRKKWAGKIRVGGKDYSR